jgi:hypothetical protein
MGVNFSQSVYERINFAFRRARGYRFQNVILWPVLFLPQSLVSFYLYHTLVSVLLLYVFSAQGYLTEPEIVQDIQYTTGLVYSYSKGK